MGQHHLAQAVADGVDAFHVGLHLVVDEDASPFVFNARVLQAQSVDAGRAAGGQQDLVADDGEVLLPGLAGQDHAVVGMFKGRDIGFGQDGDALSLQLTLQADGEILIQSRKDVASPGRAQDGHFATEGVVDAGQLHADDAAADDHEAFGNFRQFQCAGGVHAGGVGGVFRHDAPGQRGVGSRRDDDLIRGEGLLRAVGGGDLHGLAVGEGTDAFHHGDLIGFHQTLHALDHLIDHVHAVLLDLGPVEGGLAGLDAAGSGVLHALQHIGCVEEGFGGDASHVEAGAAQSAFFHQRNGRAQLGCLDGCHVSAGAAADDDYRNVFIHVSYLPLSSPGGSCRLVSALKMKKEAERGCLSASVMT